MSDTDLERRLFDRAYQNTQRIEAQPNWAYIHRELRRKGVTLSLLWEEYRCDHPDGYGYSRFCELYILDRIVHNAYRLELEGQSLRKTITKMGDETPQD